VPVTSPAPRQKRSIQNRLRGSPAAADAGFVMDKGRFVNHKLGKNVGRKTNLLKSERDVRGYGKSQSGPSHPSPFRKNPLRGKP